MATSDTSICNIGLSKIGQDTILNLSENSRAGRACNLVYEPMRKAVLRAHNWNFAIDRVELALLPTAPAFGFAFAYQLPADFLKLVATEWDKHNEVKFKVEGKTIVSDESSFFIAYIKNITDTSFFDDIFSEALSARIAAEVCLELTDNESLKQAMMKEYSDKFGEAKSSDAQDNPTDEFVTTTWANSRI